MMINETTHLDQTNWLKSLDTDRWEPTNQNLTRVSKPLGTNDPYMS